MEGKQKPGETRDSQGRGDAATRSAERPAERATTFATAQTATYRAGYDTAAAEMWQRAYGDR